MLDSLLDALKDSAIVLGVVLVINFLISFIEGKLSSKILTNSKVSPLLGASIGLIPQCGFSIVAADMYQKRHISMGTLIAVFIACSDEALPIMFSNPQKMVMILPLLGIKLVIGFLVGFLVDLLLNKEIKKIQVNEKDKFFEAPLTHTGCCHHHIEEDEKEEDHPFLHEHILHPLVHSLKIFMYVLIVNIVFAIVIYYVGEDVISNFLISNQYLTPFFTLLVGLIPNCASSVIITKLFLQGSISFGATIAGLICNAGLGLVYLFKDRKQWKENVMILGILIVTSLVTGYLVLLVENLIG